jgi:hypothetical protein
MQSTGEQDVSTKTSVEVVVKKKCLLLWGVKHQPSKL